MIRARNEERGKFLHLGILLVLLAGAWRFCNFALWLVTFTGSFDVAPEEREILARLTGAPLGLFLWVAWKATREGTTRAPAVLRRVVGAVIGGVLGGALGFDGILAWSLLDDANLGPPIALFVTGPLGTVLGLIIGGAVAVGWSKVR